MNRRIRLLLGSDIAHLKKKYNLTEMEIINLRYLYQEWALRHLPDAEKLIKDTSKLLGTLGLD